MLKSLGDSRAALRLRRNARAVAQAADMVGERNIGLIAAGIAFFALLAVFPGVAALIAFWGFMSDPAVIESQLDLVREFLPDDAFGLLTGQVDRLVSAHDSTLGLATLISTAVTLWSARLGMGALILGLNAVHGVPNRGGVGHTVMALLLTLALIGVAILAMATVVVLPVVLAFFPLGGWAFWALRIANWVVVLVVIAGAVALVYRFGPNMRPRVRWVSPGLALAVALWAVASVGFAEFLSRFGDYGAIYGSLGAVIALLMWFYISAYAVLLGAVLNAQLAEGRDAAAPQPAGDGEAPGGS